MEPWGRSRRFIRSRETPSFVFSSIENHCLSKQEGEKERRERTIIVDWYCGRNSFLLVMQYSLFCVATIQSFISTILPCYNFTLREREICSIMSFCFQTELMVVTSISIQIRRSHPTLILVFLRNREPTLIAPTEDQHSTITATKFVTFEHISYRDLYDLGNEHILAISCLPIVKRKGTL